MSIGSDHDKAGVELKAYSAVKSPDAKRIFSAAKICILIVPGLSEQNILDAVRIEMSRSNYWQTILAKRCPLGHEELEETE